MEPPGGLGESPAQAAGIPFAEMLRRVVESGLRGVVVQDTPAGRA